MRILLIGTFNPAWDVERGDNPDYFYSRSKNEFWCILPHALNQNCLIDKSRKEKEQFCIDNKIGLTDIIYCIRNVNEEDKKSRFLKKGFKDEDFEKKIDGEYTFDIQFYTENLKEYINTNKGTLKGVYFTRKTSKGIERIWAQWLSIRSFCTQIGIVADELPSPSPRGSGIRNKIFDWRKKFNDQLILNL